MEPQSRPGPTVAPKKLDAQSCMGGVLVLLVFPAIWGGGAWLLHRAASTSWLASFVLAPVVLLAIFVAGLTSIHTPARAGEILASLFTRKGPPGR